MSDIELTAKQHNKVKRAVKALNDVKNELQQQNPANHINWYLAASDNLNLMSDAPHSADWDSQSESVIELFNLENASGGDW